MGRRSVAALFGVMSLVAVQGSLAQSPAASPATGRARNSPTDTDPLRVGLVLVGSVGYSVGLAQSISDLLRARGIRPRFSRQEQLTEQDLLGAEHARDPGSVTIWITLPRRELARLVLADPEFRRFLVREIPLPHGIDEFGRESIAQVVESSSLALLQGAVGMTRSEVRSALGDEFIPAPSPPPPPAERRTFPAGFRRPHLRLAATYGVAWSGPDFGLLHGPGLRSGLEFVGHGGSLLISAAFEWHFSQRHTTDEFKLEVQSNVGWLLLGWRRPIGASISLVGELGPGLDVTQVTPRAKSMAATARSSYLDATPWVRTELGFEWGSSPLVLQLLAVGDLSINKTHYDLDRDGSKSRFATPWYVRPGITVGGLWR